MQAITIYRWACGRRWPTDPDGLAEEAVAEVLVRGPGVECRHLAVDQEEDDDLFIHDDLFIKHSAIATADGIPGVKRKRRGGADARCIRPQGIMPV